MNNDKIMCTAGTGSACGFSVSAQIPVNLKVVKRAAALSGPVRCCDDVKFQNDVKVTKPHPRVRVAEMQCQCGKKVLK